jgi:uncharacterized membrane protein YfhO
MKKVKVVLWLVIIAFLGLLMYQNKDFFLAKHSLSLSLFSTGYQSLALPSAVYFVAFLLFGWLMAYLSSLADRYKAGKTIKKLQQTIQVQQGSIDAMKKDVDALKSKPAEAIIPEPIETEAAQATSI